MDVFFQQLVDISNSANILAPSKCCQQHHASCVVDPKLKDFGG